MHAYLGGLVGLRLESIILFVNVNVIFNGQLHFLLWVYKCVWLRKRRDNVFTQSYLSVCLCVCLSVCCHALTFENLDLSSFWHAGRSSEYLRQARIGQGYSHVCVSCNWSYTSTERQPCSKFFANFAKFPKKSFVHQQLKWWCYNVS